MILDVQAAAAASKTVDCLKVIHSLHVYFLLVGDFNSKYTLCASLFSWKSIIHITISFLSFILGIGSSNCCALAFA